jgi:hypothetical protein
MQKGRRSPTLAGRTYQSQGSETEVEKADRDQRVQDALTLLDQVGFSDASETVTDGSPDSEARYILGETAAGWSLEEDTARVFGLGTTVVTPNGAKVVGGTIFGVTFKLAKSAKKGVPVVKVTSGAPIFIDCTFDWEGDISGDIDPLDRVGVQVAEGAKAQLIGCRQEGGTQFIDNHDNNVATDVTTSSCTLVGVRNGLGPFTTDYNSQVI